MERNNFLDRKSMQITIPGVSKNIDYDPASYIALVHSKLGASKAIQIGAYVYALNNI